MREITNTGSIELQLLRDVHAVNRTRLRPDINMFNTTGREEFLAGKTKVRKVHVSQWKKIVARSKDRERAVGRVF
jgi:hypothetical protein